MGLKSVISAQLSVLGFGGEEKKKWPWRGKTQSPPFAKGAKGRPPEDGSLRQGCASHPWKHTC